MKMNRWEISIHLVLLLLFAGYTTSAQRSTRGIVVDSVSLKALPGVHVRIKGTDRVAATNSTGVFRLQTSVVDTLVLSMVGYNTMELPLLFEEEDIMLRMGERIQLLKEVTITGNRLYESVIIRSEHKMPHKMTTADAFSSPWEYFSRGQKEKRKVTKLISENDRVKTYVDVINNQELREDIMFEHNLTEPEYYNRLAKFNEQSRDLLYNTDPMAIVNALKNFFDRN
jgi:hypothetical protein